MKSCLLTLNAAFLFLCVYIYGFLFFELVGVILIFLYTRTALEKS
ncbi:MAG: hypothetical protein ABSH48_18230 [Verrucomicrobiota bacterium]|jgi:hypothetical protein